MPLLFSSIRLTQTCFFATQVQEQRPHLLSHASFSESQSQRPHLLHKTHFFFLQKHIPMFLHTLLHNNTHSLTFSPLSLSLSQGHALIKWLLDGLVQWPAERPSSLMWRKSASSSCGSGLKLGNDPIIHCHPGAWPPLTRGAALTLQGEIQKQSLCIKLYYKVDF